MYFISPEIYIKQGGQKGTGIYAKNDIPANVMLELSPVSSCWKSNWEENTLSVKEDCFFFSNEY